MAIFKYYTKRYSSCNCFIVEFDPKVIRFDLSVGTDKKLEKLSKMNGDIRENEVPLAKLNGGFFDTKGTSDYIGGYIDEGKMYQINEPYYPVAIFWKDYQLLAEFDPTETRQKAYVNNANWAIGCPWTVIVNGKYDYHYPKGTLTRIFGHPFTKQPRSMMGQKADGTIVWVAVDGRSSNSVGMTLDTCGKLMLELGCVNAFNLDGGGSTEMICHNTIVNKLSDGAERSIGTALFAYLNLNDEIYGKVNADNLNVRAQSSTKSNIITQLSEGTEVKIIGYSYGWFKIKYKNITGWCSGPYIDLTSTKPTVTEVEETKTEEHTKIAKKPIGLDELKSMGYKKIDLI